MREKVEVYVERCRDDVILPTYANKYDAGMDIRSCEDIVIKPNETVIVPTGLKFAIPEGYEIQVRPRSGLSYKTPLRISNSPGTIDAGYRDEVGIIVTNISQIEAIEIKKNDRIAQIVLQRVPEIVFREVDDISKIGSNRGGGFGSTGKS
ncbi:MAG: dUTP diphosphatase [Clostridiaceae bacterium]|nr:dUTP diphosphatase [Clostridiaceae bacterium]